MPLPDLRGHETVREQLARAVLSGTVPQSILLHGPAGIGKERLGLWLAQLLVCETPAPAGPCGRCRPCRLVLRLEHPDVHWFFPLPRPDASSPEKLREKLEDARAVELQARRDDPHHLPSYDRAPAHFLASILTLQKLAGVRPAMGRRKVFVVGDAELMVPQESSPEAANAFLKLLEEPPTETVLVLTSSQPGALLPTILSRVLPVRLRPLSVAAVRDFLVEEKGSGAAAAEEVARRARGAIGRALRLSPAGDGTGPLERHRQAARSLLLAALAESPTLRLAEAHERPPAGARGDLTDQLAAFAEWLRDLMAVSAGAAEQVANADDLPILQRAVDQLEIRPLGVGSALRRVATAQELAEGNVNPQLILADLLRGVQRDLRPPRERAVARRA